MFGSGLAIVPFLHGGVVKEFGWLSERQFLDAVAVAMITPGPGRDHGRVHRLPGRRAGRRVVAAIGVFLPCYLFVDHPGALLPALVADPRVKAFVDGVTAAATGAIAGAAFVLGRRAVVDGPTLAIAFATLAISWRFRKVPEPVLILVAGIVGVLLKGLG